MGWYTFSRMRSEMFQNIYKVSSIKQLYSKIYLMSLRYETSQIPEEACLTHTILIHFCLKHKMLPYRIPN